MTNTCSRCQYWRTLQNANKPICTNLKSKLFNANTESNESCSEFMKRGQKAPLWIRFIIKQLTGLKCSKVIDLEPAIGIWNACVLTLPFWMFVCVVIVWLLLEK